MLKKQWNFNCKLISITGVDSLIYSLLALSKEVKMRNIEGDFKRKQ